MASGAAFTVQELRRLGQSLRPAIANAESTGDIGHVGGLLKSLLDPRAFSSDSKVCAAAIDCLCGLLDRCSASDKAPLRDLVLQQKTWNAAFSLFAAQSDNMKAKSSRKLLETLISLLRKQETEKTQLHLIDKTVQSCILAIFGFQSSCNLKPAIQFLDVSMSQHVIEAPAILRSVQAQHQVLPNEDPRSDEEESSKDLSNIAQALILGILQWVRYPDCVPAVSRFVASFVKSFDFHCIHLDMSKSLQGPIWLRPFQQFLLENNDVLDVLESQVLTTILVSQPDDIPIIFKLLLNQKGRTKAPAISRASNIQLCLCTARVAIREVSRARNSPSALVSTRFHRTDWGSVPGTRKVIRPSYLRYTLLGPRFLSNTSASLRYHRAQP